MKKYIYKVILLIPILLIVFSSNSFSQRFHEDIVHLKDGSLIRGWIVEQVPGEYVKIELLGGSILVYQQSDIEKITKEYSRYKSIRRQLNVRRMPIQFRETGYYGSFNMDFMFNEGQWGLRLDPSIRLSAGYRFNRFLGVGLGTGIDFYEAGVIVPIYAEANGDLLKKRFTPHYQVQLGYGFGAATTWVSDSFKGGLMGQAGLGLKTRTRSRIEFIYMLVFKAQETTDVQRPWNWGNPLDRPTITRNRLYQSLAIHLGIAF